MAHRRVSVSLYRPLWTWGPSGWHRYLGEGSSVILLRPTRGIHFSPPFVEIQANISLFFCCVTGWFVPLAFIIYAVSFNTFPPVCQHTEPADTCLRRHSLSTVLNAKNNQRDTHCRCAHFSRGANTRLVWLTSQTVNRHETQKIKGLIGQCLCLKLFNRRRSYQ